MNLYRTKSKVYQSKPSTTRKFLKQEQMSDDDTANSNYIDFPIIQRPIIIEISDEDDQQPQIAIRVNNEKEDQGKFRVKRINGCFQMNDEVYFQVLIGTAKTTFRQPQILSFDKLNRGKRNKMLIYNYMIKLSLSNDEQQRYS